MSMFAKKDARDVEMEETAEDLEFFHRYAEDLGFFHRYKQASKEVELLREQLVQAENRIISLNVVNAKATAKIQAQRAHLNLVMKKRKETVDVAVGPDFSFLGRLEGWGGQKVPERQKYGTVTFQSIPMPKRDLNTTKTSSLPKGAGEFYRSEAGLFTKEEHKLTIARQEKRAGESKVDESSTFPFISGSASLISHSLNLPRLPPKHTCLQPIELDWSKLTVANESGWTTDARGWSVSQRSPSPSKAPLPIWLRVNRLEELESDVKCSDVVVTRKRVRVVNKTKLIEEA